MRIFYLVSIFIWTKSIHFRTRLLLYFCYELWNKLTLILFTQFLEKFMEGIPSFHYFFNVVNSHLRPMISDSILRKIVCSNFSRSLSISQLWVEKSMNAITGEGDYFCKVKNMTTIMTCNRRVELISLCCFCVSISYSFVLNFFKAISLFFIWDCISWHSTISPVHSTKHH